MVDTRPELPPIPEAPAASVKPEAPVSEVLETNPLPGVNTKEQDPAISASTEGIQAAIQQEAQAQELPVNTSLSDSSKPLQESKTLLPGGFKSLDAYRSYEEFLAAIDQLNVKTGEGMKQFFQATEKVQKYMWDMPIATQLSILGKLFKIAVTALAYYIIRKVTTKKDSEEKTSQKDDEPKIPSERTRTLSRQPEPIPA